MEELFADACRRAKRYLAEIEARRVGPAAEDVLRLAAFQEPLPEAPCDAREVLATLDDIGSPATVASAGGRYFGFVTGGSLPAALAANWLAGAWDQNGALRVMSPTIAALEDVVDGWLRDVFGLPASSVSAFVTGATMANFTCLAAARHALLERAGWNVEEQGLFGAPPLPVVVSDEAHVSLLKALALLGLGRSRVIRVPTDGQGRMRADLLPRLDSRTIVCLQAGNVNTGAFDPAREICARAKENKAWVHVDGAFGLWAATAPARAHLMNGFSEADSWATDCHKWLNVPYDSGVALVRDGKDLRSAMELQAAYLQSTNSREPSQYTPEASRRARVVEVWAALRALGRSGLAEMIERTCRLALQFAGAFRAEGWKVLNEVVLNQVLVSFGDSEMTRQIVSAVQEQGVCWCGATEWHGQAAMRISVSSWKTTEQDVKQSVAAILRAAERISGRAKPANKFPDFTYSTQGE